MARLRRVALVLIGLVLVILCIIGLAIATLETTWGKDQIRQLIVRQANKHLTATLEIESLRGSLFRGIELGHVRLSRDGRPLVAIDDITVDYNIRELLGPGVVVRRVRLVRPRIVGARQADGRWDLGALVKREQPEAKRSGPGRPIEVQTIEIVDGEVHVKNPLDFGDAHAPTTFKSLNASLSFASVPERWGLTFNWMSWIGLQPALTVTGMTGTFGHGPGGWFFDTLRVITSRSTFTLRGLIDTDAKPTHFNLRVAADRFAFQEWAGIIHGLRDIAVESSFEALLKGNPRALGVDLRLTGGGGAVRGHLTLDTTEPGWHSRGTVDVERLELGHWLNRRDRPSDITGKVVFDLALGLGQHFPQGTYRFTGPRVMYMGYAANDLRAEGRITKDAVLIEQAVAAAYSASVSISTGSIGLAEPYPYRFAGRAAGVDLRRLPATVPVPRVDSRLTFAYDVSGRFNHPDIVGRATFGPSQFLGASIGAGTVGTIDTSRRLLRYSGEGAISAVSVTRFGRGLDVAWMRDPRYEGTINGRFRVDGSGSDRNLTLTVTGRLTRADLFAAAFTDADVSMNISGGTLTATYNGAFQDVNPAIPFADDRFAATLSGTGQVTATVRNLLTAGQLALDDYDISGTLSLEDSSVRGVHLDHASVDAALCDGALSITQLAVSGPAVDATGSGSVVFGEPPSIDFAFDATRLDLDALKDATHLDATGIVATKGHATGPIDALHLAGDLSGSELDAYGVAASALTSTYDVTVGSDRAIERAQLSMHGSSLTVFGTALHEASGTASYDASTLKFDFALVQTEERQGHLAGTVTISHPRADATAFAIAELQATLGTATWQLASSSVPPTVTWTEGEIDVTPMSFLTPGGAEGRVTVSGSWRQDGAGALRVAASHVFLESLQGGGQRPSEIGGLLDADVTLSGTRDHPEVSGTATITNGRVERVGYQQLTAQVTYADQLATVDLRLEQSPGVTITAVGSVPRALFDPSVPDRPIDLTIKSTSISLGLLEGITTVVREVSGDGRFDVHVVGSGREPRFDGSVSLANVAFAVTSTGSKYRNGNAVIQVTPDRITVESLRLQDAGGHTLEVKGSLGAHELSVGELQLDAVARRFEVLRNELGRISVDAALSFRGTFAQPRVTGQVGITSGEIRVDEVLSRVLFQPYATTPTELPQIDAVAALNPWERLTLDVALSAPKTTLRLTGSNVQIAPGTPIGISNINLRVGGDLSLYKDPGDSLSVTGSLDSISGAVGFQSRRFTIDESASSINFQGDLNPELFITVTRQIAAVETRVTVSGPLKQPELQLSSVPPLDSSNILSLIVFNTTTNELTPQQQQELVVRAGTLAAGFLAAPIVSAIQQQIGLQVLNIEPSTDIINVGPRVTVGQELAPGLVAQFSRQFGQEPYNEAIIEYYLTRILRLRATFSDAQSLVALSPFRYHDRAGIDLLAFFSF